jgi:phosphoglycerate dehydrogenase-like enzyme
MARYATAFGMRVLAWSQNLGSSTAQSHGARPVTKEELFAQSDIVSVHVVSSARTRGIVGQRELERLGPNGFLVNTSRGPVVDEDALVKALQARTIAGAGLDVFDIEPLPLDHVLRTLPNTVLTPHVAYGTEEMYQVFFREIVENICAWHDNRPVRVLLSST